MSAIAGVIRFDGGPVQPGTVEGMTAAMAHRGPDGIAHWHGDGVALGQCQMCTTPESLEETQPLTNEDESLVLVMDGRVDNWEELRTLLLDKGARLRTRADAELVLRAYEVWGRDCVKHIDGDFALVIWDARRREAFCARDRMGVKPFYLHLTEGRLAFATQMNALLALPDVPLDLNDGIVLEILLDSETSLTETLWKGIERLPAATMMTTGADGTATARYWSPEDLPEIIHRQIEDHAEEFRAILLDAVRRRSRSRDGVACEVSGGLDSSLVFGMAAQLNRDGRFLAQNLGGYCLRFPEGTRADEITYSRAMARHAGLPVEEVPATRLPLDWYRDWANTMHSFPVHPNGMMSLDLYKRCIRQGRPVVLTGLGGDEWCYGSPYTYADLLQHTRLGGFTHAFLNEARARGLRLATFRALRFGVYPLLPAWLQRASEAAYRAVHPRVPDVSRYKLTDEAERLFAQRLEDSQIAMIRPKTARHIDTLECLLDAKRASGFEKRDEITAFIGVEHRHPYADRNVVEYCFQTPEWTRRFGARFRVTQRLAAAEYLPDEVKNRKTKAEFSTVILQHLDEIRTYGDGLTDRQAGRWVRQGEFSSMLQLARESTGYGRAKWSAWGLFGCALLSDSVDNQ